MTVDLLADLEERGLIHDTTDRRALAAHLAGGGTTLYCGLDPSADSLHVGNLQQLQLLRRFQLAGHRPIALVGGATGRIGDPSGKDKERPLLDDAAIDLNVAAISGQFARFVDFSSESAGLLVDNREWIGSLSAIDFLRDVGKHVTVSTMLSRESVRSRLDRDQGLSYTEFSYMLLQAYDFLVLHERYGCGLQTGGSDQWGNILAGVDLVRRRLGRTVHGLATPLVTRADGRKFGKTEEGAVWLSAERTSPFRFHQYWLNVADADLEPLLLRLTLLDVTTCRDLLADHDTAPERREAQRVLARELTDQVHGTDQRQRAEAAGALLFGSSTESVTATALETLVDEIPTTRLSPQEFSETVEGAVLVAEAGLAPSRGEARRNAAGYRINGVSLADRPVVGRADLLHSRYLLLRRGRAHHHLVLVDEGTPDAR